MTRICVFLSLSPLQIYRTRQTSNILPAAVICSVPLQSAPAEAEESLLIRTMSTVHSYKHVWAIRSSSADLSASSLFVFHLRAGGDATAHRLVRLKFIHPLCSLCPVKKGLQMKYYGSSRELADSERVSRRSPPEGSDITDAFMTPRRMGHFFSYLASVEKVPERIIKGAMSTVRAFNGAG